MKKIKQPLPLDYLIIVEESKLAATGHQGTVGHVLPRKLILRGIDVRHLERAVAQRCKHADTSRHAVGDGAVVSLGSKASAVQHPIHHVCQGRRFQAIGIPSHHSSQHAGHEHIDKRGDEDGAQCSFGNGRLRILEGRKTCITSKDTTVKTSFQ